MKKLCLLIALCVFSYTIKGAAAADHVSYGMWTTSYHATEYRAEGYEEEKTLYKQIMREQFLFHETITPSVSTEKLIKLMKQFITLLKTTHLFLWMEEAVTFHRIINRHLGVILATNQIETALLEGNKELLEILKEIDELTIERVVPLSPASTFKPLVITPSAPINPYIPQLVYFSSPSQEESRYYAIVSPREEKPHSYVRIYNAAREIVYEVAMTHDEQKIDFCCFSPDQENVVINVGNVFKIIHIASGTVLREINKVDFFLHQVIKSPTGKYIAVYTGCIRDEKITILDAVTGEVAVNLESLGRLTHFSDSSFSPDEKFFLFRLSGRPNDGSMLLTSLESKETITLVQHHDWYFNRFMFSSDGKLIIAQSKHKVTVHDVATKEKIYEEVTSTDEEEFKDLEVSSDGKRLAVKSSTRGILIIDLDLKKITHTFPLPHSSRGILSPDGKLLAITSDDEYMTKTDVQIIATDSEKVLCTSTVICTSTVKGKGWEDVKRSHFTADGRTLVLTKSEPGHFHINLPPLTTSEYDSSRQQLLLNALDHKRKTGCTAVSLAPELMDCLTALPATCRPLLKRQAACTVAWNSTWPSLLPAAQDTTETCSICIELLTTERIVYEASQEIEELGQVVITPCGHLFHKNCITRALTPTASCALCRAPMNESQLTSLEAITTLFPQFESHLRANPFITLPKNAQQATTNFERDFSTLPATLKNQLRTLQQELQKTLETAFEIPVATEESQAAAEAEDTESATVETTSTETIPAGGAAEETREQKRERLLAAALARAELEKASK